MIRRGAAISLPVQACRPAVFAVGRLDRDTTGLLLFTNDGDLASAVLRPDHRIDTLYCLSLGEVLSTDDPRLIQLVEGATRNGEVLAAPSESIVATTATGTELALTLTQGRNPQVRRMCAALGLLLVCLHCRRIGPLTDADLAPGAFRMLDPAELEVLCQSVGGRAERKQSRVAALARQAKEAQDAWAPDRRPERWPALGRADETESRSRRDICNSARMRISRAVGLGLGLLLGGAWIARRARRYDLRGKNALVTGGSRGLGLEIARVLASRGANVAIVSRDMIAIDRALVELRQSYPAVRFVGESCDLRAGSSIDAMLGAVRSALGPLDVLVNDAGMIEVGPLDAMTVDDFESAMKIHCFAPLRTMLGVRDDMVARGGGRIANIASVGGLLSVPHMLPYSASKFALVGLSEGMHVELARDKIVVSTIAPGLMRTGSPRNAKFKGDHQAEYAWFSLSDSLPVVSMSSERAAKRIVRALEYGEAHVVVGAPAKLAAIAHGIAPGVVVKAMTLANRLLPKGTDPTAKQGKESESTVTASPLTAATRRAAARNNEMASHEMEKS